MKPIRTWTNNPESQSSVNVKKRHIQVDNNIRQKKKNEEKKDISDDGSDELSDDEETRNSEESVTSEIISNKTMENLSTRKPLACMR